MRRPYSLNLRERVISAVVDGMSCRDPAARRKMGHFSVIRWVGRTREEGNPTALSMDGNRPFFIVGGRDWAAD